jgi:hypothetical protein
MKKLVLLGIAMLFAVASFAQTADLAATTNHHGPSTEGQIKVVKFYTAQLKAIIFDLKADAAEAKKDKTDNNAAKLKIAKADIVADYKDLIKDHKIFKGEVKELLLDLKRDAKKHKHKK